MGPRRSSKPVKTKLKLKLKSKTKTLVNWLDLPRDLMIQILIKIGTIELLYNAQRVCSSWRAIAKDPQLYRAVDLRNPWKYFEQDSFDVVEKMARRAIDRSRGQLVEFSIENFCTDVILYKLMYKSPGLKCLRLTNCSCGFGEGCLIEVLEKLPLLEEVEFILPSFSMDVIKTIGRSCLNLKSFRMNGWGTKISPEEAMEEEEFNDEGDVFNEQVFAIAANSMNNNGLEALLGRFTRLEYLDLRRCANLDLKGDLLKKCQGIKTLRLPNDSIDDYQFQVGDDSMDGEYDYSEEDFGWWMDGESDYSNNNFGWRW